LVCSHWLAATDTNVVILFKFPKEVESFLQVIYKMVVSNW